MPGAPLPDHRRSPEGTLLAAIRSGDHLALAEAWQRTAPAAHAVARRLAGPADTEDVLHRLYAELWRSPSITEPLERWARARCFALSVELLRAEGRGPAAFSVGCVTPDLPAPRAAALDPVERVLAGLPDDAARALVRAHDQGLPTWTHPEPGAPAALRLALRTLAGAADVPDPDGADDHPLGDLALGLLDSAQAEVLQNLLLDTPDLAEHARLLRRGGRYVVITGCYNDTYGQASREVSLINAHYICDIHPRSAYFRALARNRLVPVHVEDLTEAALPYWELRKEADHLVTGIEDTFLTAYRNGSFQYLLIAADRV